MSGHKSWKDVKAEILAKMTPKERKEFEAEMERLKRKREDETQ